MLYSGRGPPRLLPAFPGKPDPRAKVSNAPQGNARGAMGSTTPPAY